MAICEVVGKIHLDFFQDLHLNTIEILIGKVSFLDNLYPEVIISRVFVDILGHW